ncbi:MAG: hypothetical protein IKK42_07715 [Oscillospiraceae bacterium]|nr:hypothetical protein [Oscillospiraceae bacterium]
MKKIALALVMAMLLTACGSAGDGAQTTDLETTTEVIAEVTETVETTEAVTTTQETTTTEATTTTVVTTTTEMTTTTASPEEILAVVSSDKLTDDTLEFFDRTNSFREKEDVDKLEYSETLEGCAKGLTDAFSKSGSFYTNFDKNEFCENYFAENGIEYTNYDFSYGMTFSYGVYIIFNTISFDRSAQEKMSDSIWEYAGFYYDPDSLFWAVIYLTDDEMPEKNSADSGIDIYFDNSTQFDTLNTYLRALVYDDYEAYLAITEAPDNDETRDDFDYNKKNYVGVDMGSILYYETELNPLYGYSNTDYKVIEFDSDGSYSIDINTFGDAYGVVRIDESSTGGYYVSGHVRYSPFFNVQ